ncbi:MAG: hypothetical protein HQL40_19150 [Alphaproteobacteria bacterium]|nr:hypothetical protein [Alphaproteobacteria bacterium]
MAAPASIPRRHPWLAALEAAPLDEMRALVGGYAEIGRFQGAEPGDAAESLLFGLDGDDPARRAFDDGCLELLRSLRADLLAAQDDTRRLRLIATIDRLISVIRRTVPHDTVRDLHRRYAWWFGAFETAVVDRSLDLRREFWRLIALTQWVIATDPEPRRLLGLWLGVCAQAGEHGTLGETYLDIGLIGLRKLPLGEEQSSNEEAVCHGLALWAARQSPKQAAFLARAAEIESLYPSDWPGVVASVLAVLERPNALGRFPAADWWRQALDLVSETAAEAPSFEPPPKEWHVGVLRDIGQPLGILRPRVEALWSGHRGYADATGDVFYAVRTACNVGMKLLNAGDRSERAQRGALAVTLARAALDYAPTHAHAWALWRDGLAAQGALREAELVGWESIRRFPEDPQWRTQLASLLAEDLGRPEEAERLLRDTAALFPDNAVARTQLAGLLADLGRLEEARALLVAAITTWPENMHSYTQLAILYADRLDRRSDAIAVLEQGLRQDPGDRPVARLLDNARGGRRLAARKPLARRPVIADGPLLDLGFDVRTALARRALFRVETGDSAGRDEIRRIVEDDPGLAYARYVAERTGVKSFGRLDTAVAFAFERARRQAPAPLMGFASYLAVLGGRVLMGEDVGPPPVPANQDDEGAYSNRVAVLVEALGKGGAEAKLRLVSDFAAAELSLTIAAA